ncbi:MAG TPA: STAS domain-containing protein [Kineosporiaceae bacterium]
MHPRRYDRSGRSRLTAVSSSGIPERHPRLTLNWSDPLERTHTAVHVVSGIPIMIVEGALVAAAAKPCREALDAVLRMRPTRMVMDLGGVRETDRTTVQLLEAMRRFTHWHGVAMSLAAVPGVVQVRFEGVRIDPPFDIHSTSDRAVTAALAMPRARRSVTPRDSMGGTG